MLKHGAQAIHDREAKSQPGLAPLRRSNLIKLTEDAALLIGRDADTAVTHIDAQRAASVPAADNYPALPTYSERRWTPG